MPLKPFAAAITLMIFVAGCSKDASLPSGATPAANLTVNPADGQANVRFDATVIFTFARRVDRASGMGVRPGEVPDVE